jgi:hypothetical protein
MALVNSKQSQRDDIIKYIGILGQAFTCPACARRIKKGLLRHKDSSGTRTASWLAPPFASTKLLPPGPRSSPLEVFPLFLSLGWFSS